MFKTLFCHSYNLCKILHITLQHTPENMKMSPLYRNDEIEIYAPDTTASEAFAKFIDDRVSCGFASPANDFFHEPIDMNDLLIDNRDSTFVIKAMGVSMIEAGIHPGDYLIFDRGKPYYPGGIALCVLNNEFTVKYVDLEKKQLTPANKDFNPIQLSEGDELAIWAMLSWSLKKHYGK